MIFFTRAIKSLFSWSRNRLICSGDTISISDSVLVLIVSNDSFINRILALLIVLGIAELSIVLSITVPLINSMSVTFPIFSSILMSSMSTCPVSKLVMSHIASRIISTIFVFSSCNSKIAFPSKHVVSNFLIVSLSLMLDFILISSNISKA